jgi:formylglycine-generating enzyme required for sulfatase activity
MRLPILAALILASTAQAERIALVIGNATYDNLSEAQQLDSPDDDATAVAGALKSLGYTVVTGGPLLDAPRESMISAVERFTAAARNAEAAVFYFSGHGIQVGEDQFLIPRDTPPLTGFSVLTNRAVKLRESVMMALEENNAGTKVMILDCCRDNPFSAQLERALQQVGKSVKTKSLGEITGYGPGFYLAFATSPGSTADDGNGAVHSPFTAALLAAIPGSAGKDIDFFFRDVKKRLGAEQVSWTNHSLQDGFALVGRAPSVPITNTSPPKTPARAPFEGSRAGDTKTIGGIDMIWCPPGTFLMGSPAAEEGREDNESQHRVTLTKGFWLAQTECTQSQWKAVMGTSPSKFEGPRLPVEQVTWEDAMEWCGKMNASAQDLLVGWTWTLPTEAQWEYACRAGLTGPYAGTSLDGLGWYSSNSGDRAHPVGSKKANPWGFYDMHGNVFEWCLDYYDDYPSGTVTDPSGATTGSGRVLRGGWWGHSARLCRSAYRNRNAPGYRYSSVGFRPAVSLP